MNDKHHYDSLFEANCFIHHEAIDKMDNYLVHYAALQPKYLHKIEYMDWFYKMRNKHGMTAMHYLACSNQSIPYMQPMQQACNWNRLVLDDKLRTPLCYAVIHNQLKMVQYLLSLFANSDEKKRYLLNRDRHSNVVLHYACTGNHKIAMLKFLIQEYGGVQAMFETNAILCAIYSNTDTILELLVNDCKVPLKQLARFAIQLNSCGLLKLLVTRYNLQFENSDVQYALLINSRSCVNYIYNYGVRASPKDVLEYIQAFISANDFTVQGLLTCKEMSQISAQAYAMCHVRKLAFCNLACSGFPNPIASDASWYKSIKLVYWHHEKRYVSHLFHRFWDSNTLFWTSNGTFEHCRTNELEKITNPSVAMVQTHTLFFSKKQLKESINGAKISICLPMHCFADVHYF